VETLGNYYNYQLVDEFKLDVDQVLFLEVNELDHVQVANYFFETFTKEEFYPIYDKIGGNLSKMRDFCETYFNIDQYPQEFEKKAFPELKYAISLFLSKEKVNFTKKMKSAQLLMCRYLAEKNNKEMDYEFNHYLVEFKLLDLIKSVMSSHTRGLMEKNIIETIDIQTSIPGAALINSDIFYFNIERNYMTLYHRSYYNLLTNFMDEKFKEWGVLKTFMFQIWRFLFGLKIKIDNSQWNFFEELKQKVNRSKPENY
jgi:hypothetical protein